MQRKKKLWVSVQSTAFIKTLFSCENKSKKDREKNRYDLPYIFWVGFADVAGDHQTWEYTDIFPFILIPTLNLIWNFFLYGLLVKTYRGKKCDEISFAETIDVYVK